MKIKTLLLSGIVASAALPVAAAPQLLWGDTHVHSAYSFDAFLNGNHSATPDVAYRFARGEPVIHPATRARVQIDRPLDFIVVADHAEFMGVAREAYYEGMQLPEDAGPIDRLMGWGTALFIRYLVDQGGASGAFEKLMPKAEDPAVAAQGQLPGAPINMDFLENKTWQSSIELADAYYEPGEFTTFIGWEWSSTPGGVNLHRIVMSDADSVQARLFEPFSAVDSPFPEDLWRWMANTAETTGVEFLSIPHNSNISKGYMFDETSLRGEPIDTAYASLRTRWEPVAEVTQIKGDSETHELLSPNDEFAEFETYGWYMQADYEQYQPKPGDYLRPALKRGLQIQGEAGVNPYRLGLIGSTDSHTALSSADERDFYGKHANQAVPETKSREDGRTDTATGWSMSASGRAAVWAEDNTREAIMAALQRREVYATTGPRIALQFYGGWNLSSSMLKGAELSAKARISGVPMGGELSVADDKDVVPGFIIVAQKDPRGANLDQVQIVKGWLNEKGETEERIFAVNWAGARSPGPDGKLPPVGNTVDLDTGRYTNTIGATQLMAYWRDPDFNPGQAAFYYVRVLEIPTPHHLFLDAIALGREAPPDNQRTLQERAYSSPIWYQPPITAGD